MTRWTFSSTSRSWNLEATADPATAAEDEGAEEAGAAAACAGDASAGSNPCEDSRLPNLCNAQSIRCRKLIGTVERVNGNTKSPPLSKIHNVSLLTRRLYLRLWAALRSLTSMLLSSSWPLLSAE